MSHIVLTEEQTRLLRGANGPVEVRDPLGQPVASLSLLDAHALEAIERFHRSRKSPRRPGIPSHRVQAMLQKLDEIDAREGVTAEMVAEELRKLHAGDAP